ncbi:MAG TPA: diacylglycerol kinase [Gammaproteobacteria bacterium]|nr:diacylglycerol kinase [Gammaproteobacteria bacterium]
MKPGKTGLMRIINAARYSLKGLCYAWKNEAAFRQECLLALVLIPAAFWIGGDAVQRSLLIGSCLIVLIVEIFNSAIEAVVDRIGSEYHVLAGSAKDLGSAAVLVSLIQVLAVWGMILAERFL